MIEVTGKVTEAKRETLQEIQMKTSEMLMQLEATVCKIKMDVIGEDNEAEQAKVVNCVIEGALHTRNRVANILKCAVRLVTLFVHKNKN